MAQVEVNNQKNFVDMVQDMAEGLLQSRNKGAEPGELCGLCGTSVNEGMKVCTGCQATRVVTFKGPLGLLAATGVFLLGIIMAGSVLMLFFGSGHIIISLLLLALTVGAMFLFMNKTASRVVYREKQLKVSLTVK